MAKAKSVIDTILGEAAYGTRAQRYNDMLGIASVIANRASTTNTTPEQVVSARGQFDAYGKALPAGVNSYRSLAEQAWQQVQIDGPIHNATFYATPSAAKNLPKGLQKVSETKGHQYFTDPQNRAIRTAVGYVRPVANAIASIPSAAVETLKTIAAPAQSVAAALRTAAFDPVSSFPTAPTPTPRPSVGISAPPPVGDLQPRAMSPISYNLGPHRPNRVGADLEGRLQQAVTDTLGPGYGVEIYSGQGQYGSSRHRDPAGIAADIHVVDLATGQRVSDPQAMMDVAQAFSAQGGLGVGYGPEYMGLDAMHLDTVTPGVGQDHEWGSIGNANAGLLSHARNYSLMPASYYDRNLPATMSVPGAPSPLAAAPSGTVERAPLGPVRSSMPARPSTPTPGAALASMSQPSSLPAVPSGTVARAPLGPVSAPTPMPSRPVSPTPPAALAAMTAPKAPSLPSALTSPELMGPAQTFAPQDVQPQFVSSITPPVAPPVTPPVTVPKPVAPQPARNSFPSAPAVRSMPSAMDVYNGRANVGLANDGSTVSRDQFGNVSITNKYGATTTSLPNGQSAVSFNKAPPSSFPTAPSIAGPLGNTSAGITTKQNSGMFGIEPAKTETGNLARGFAGAMAGSALGSLVGPVGSLVGAAIGRSIAQGKNPFDALTGNRVTYNTPAFGQITAVAPNLSGSMGRFPTAPTSRGALGGTQSNRSRSSMNSISPGAASAISRGAGGLY